MTLGSVARCRLCCCTDGVVAVVTVVVLALLVVDVTLVAIAVVELVVCAAGLDHISWALGHPFDQLFSGAVGISRTVFGYSIFCGMTIVY
jgi:hypothetical protein